MTFIVAAEGFSTQLYSSLSKISHPLEGTFYLFLLAVFFRWRWPISWNNFLKAISARNEKRNTNNSET